MDRKRSQPRVLKTTKDLAEKTLQLTEKKIFTAVNHRALTIPESSCVAVQEETVKLTAFLIREKRDRTWMERICAEAAVRSAVSYCIPSDIPKSVVGE